MLDFPAGIACFGTPCRGGIVSPATARTKNLTVRIKSPAPLAAPLLRSKLVRPNEGPDLLERTRLVDALAAHGDRPLSLVVADAGYGKTTLLVAASRRLRRPV